MDYDMTKIEKAFYNSYNVITGKVSIEEIGDDVLIHNPNDDIGYSTIEDLITFFLEQGDFNKCAELKNLLEKIK